MLATYLALDILPEATGTPTPTPAPSDMLTTFRARYPAFAAVADATVQIWLDEGAGETVNFPTATQDRATMLYAAHKLAMLGQAGSPIGVTSFRSGSFSATISDSIASRTGFRATIYGQEYLALARRAFGGPRLAWTPPTNVC